MPTDANDTVSDAVSARCAWEQVARDLASEEGVPPALFAAVINQESRFDPDIPGGIAQIDLRYHDVAVGPVNHLRYAARLLAQYRSLLGRYDLALAAYNAGYPQVAISGTVPPAARHYVSTVMQRGWEPSPCALRAEGDVVVAAALVAAMLLR